MALFKFLSSFLDTVKQNTKVQVLLRRFQFSMDNWYIRTGWIPTLLAAVGNALVIYLVSTRRKLRTVTLNRFVLSLAASDFCVGACYYPGHVICYFLNSSCHSKIRDDISVMVIYASVTNLCAMTVDRYIAITKPLQYKSLMTVERASLIAAVAWLIPFWLYFVPSFCASLNLFYLKTEISIIIWTILFEFIPCSFLLLSTIRALMIVRRHSRNDSRVQIQLRFNQPILKQRSSYASVRVTVTVVAIFLICYTVEVYSSFCYFTELCTSTKHLGNVVRFLVITNSAANPIAYAFLKRDFKRELRTFLWGKRWNAEKVRSERTTQV